MSQVVNYLELRRLSKNTSHIYFVLLLVLLTRVIWVSNKKIKTIQHESINRYTAHECLTCVQLNASSREIQG